MFSLGLAVAFVGMLGFALSDILAKRVSEKLGNKRATLMVLVLSMLPMIVGTYFFGISKINTTTIFFSFLSGVLYAIAFLLLYKSLETEQVANTISLGGIEFAVITIFSILILGEGVTNLEILCIIGIFIGVFLVTTTKKFEFNSGYLPAIFSMIFFAATYFSLIYASNASGGILIPSLMNRFVAVLITLFYLKFFPERNKKFRSTKLIGAKKQTLMAGIFMGIFNGIGGTALLALASINFVAIGSVIVSAESAAVILLGYLFYKERFSKHQVVGFVLLVMGIMLLSAAA